MVGIKDEKTGKYTGVNGTGGLISADRIADLETEHKGNPEGFSNAMKKEGAYTGDYDVHDIFDKYGRRAKDGSDGEKKFTNAANDAMGRTRAKTRMIQHGPQANLKEHLDKNPKKAAEMREAFKDTPGKFEAIQQPDVRPRGEPPKIKDPLLHFDKNGEMYEIKTEDELKDLYACKGTKYPEHWEE
jgi:hypothetical protein